MRRPPRNVQTERLVSGPSIFYSYVVAGGGSALVCMGCYFLVYTRAGIPISQLAFSLDQGYFAAPPFTATATPGVYTAANGNIVPILVAQSNGRRLDAYDQWTLFCQSSAAWYLTVILNQAWCVPSLWLSRPACALTRNLAPTSKGTSGTAARAP